jgi:hypothetical protein
MPQIPKYRGSSRSVAPAALCLVAAVGVGAWWIFGLNSPQARYSAAMSQAEQLDRLGKYTQETGVLTGYLAGKPAAADRYEPLILLGNLAGDKRQDNAAISYYLQAMAANGGQASEFLAESIGEAAAAAGKKDLAITYFTEALEQARIHPQEADNLADLTATLAHLEANQ